MKYRYNKGLESMSIEEIYESICPGSTPSALYIYDDTGEVIKFNTMERFAYSVAGLSNALWFAPLLGDIKLSRDSTQIITPAGNAEPLDRVVRRNRTIVSLYEKLGIEAKSMFGLFPEVTNRYQLAELLYLCIQTVRDIDKSKVKRIGKYKVKPR